MLSEPPVDDPNHEQRRFPRVDLFQEIACEGDGVVARSQVADIGVGGMFIDMFRTPFARGTRIKVRFMLHADEGPLLVAADMHYVQDAIGVGVRFVDLSDEDRGQIAAYVDEALRRKGAGAPPVRKSARVSVSVPVRVRGFQIRFVLPEGQ